MPPGTDRADFNDTLCWERPISLGPQWSTMSRDGTRTRDRSGGPADPDFDFGVDEDVAPAAERGSEGGSRRGGIRDRVAARAKRLFAPRLFLLALALSAGGTFVAGTFVPLLPATGLLGLFAATFVFGLAVRERRYAEAAAAGGLVTGVGFLLDFAVISALGGLGVGVPVAALGAGLGVVVALAGTYFGRDLRHGLTRDVA